MLDIPKYILLNILYNYALLRLPNPEKTLNVASSTVASLKSAVEAEENLEYLTDDGLGEAMWGHHVMPRTPLKIAFELVNDRIDKNFYSVDLGSGYRKLNVSLAYFRNFETAGFDALYGRGAALEAITIWRQARAREYAIANPEPPQRRKTI